MPSPALQGFASSAQPLNWSDLEPAFRSALLKLHFSDNLLTALPDGETKQQRIRVLRSHIRKLLLEPGNPTT